MTAVTVRPAPQSAALAAFLAALTADSRRWIEDAACRGMDPDLFFPGQGESIREAQAVCASCPVRVECAEYAAGNNEHHGVWGGMAELGRRRLRGWS